MQRKQITSFVISETLKSDLVNAGFSEETHPFTDRAFYNNSAASKILCLQQPDNIAGFRTIESNSSNVVFDFIDFEDETVTRYWTIRELDILISSRIAGVQSSSATLSDDVWTHTLIINDTEYVGTDSEQVDAMAKALSAYLQAQNNN